MGEPCEYCGRFMKHVWYLATDEPDSWEDYWKCSQQDKHIKDRPRDFGHEPKPRASVHQAAVDAFERRMGFEWTEEYEGSREWSDAVIEAEAGAPDGG